MKKTFLFLTALVMSAMMMAAETYTISFNKGTTNGTDINAQLPANASTMCQSGVDYIASFSGDAAYYNASGCGIRIAKSKGAGTFTIVLAEEIQSQQIAKVVVYASKVSGNTVSALTVTPDGTVTTATTYDNSSLTAYALSAAESSNYQLSDISINGQLTSLKFEAPAKGYVMLHQIDIVVGGSSSLATLDSLVIKGTASKMEYEVGEAFDPAGLEVWGIFTKTVKHDSTSIITKGLTWTIDPETFEEASDNASVTLSVSKGDLTSADTIIAGIKVTEPAPLPKYAPIYTSNVEYTTDSKVIWDGVEYDALKMAKNTPATITVPANTKNLHIHAAAWNKEGNEWTISGLTDDVKLTVVADAGVAGYSPFTLQNNPETTDYFVINTNNSAAVELTFTLPKDKRGVIFGINAEMQEGVVAAPSFTPTATDFDQEVTVTLTAEEGAAIYYTLDGSEPTAASTLYEAAFTLTDTTTVKAIAIKDSKSSDVAEKTYNLIPVFASLADLVANMPAGEDPVKVKVTITSAAIDSFYVNKSGYRNGVYVTAANTAVELYEYNVPETWVAGGTVSGTIIAGWLSYNGILELQKWENGWDAISYTAPDPTALPSLPYEGKVGKGSAKLMHRGHIMILKDNKLFNLQGQLVK